MSIDQATPTIEALRALDLSVIQAGPFDICRRFADALLARKCLPAEGTEQWKAHVLVGFVASLRLDPDKAPEPLVLGGWLFPATGPESLSQDQLNALAQWLPDITDVDLKARVADCLWIAHKPRDHRHGRAALDAYLDAATRLTAPGAHWPAGVDRFERALQLGRIFNDSERVATAIEAALDIQIEGYVGPRNVRLMRLLLDRGLSNPAKYGPIAETLAHQCEQAAIEDRPGTIKLHTAREYWDAAADWKARLRENDADEVRQLRLRASETFVLLADKSRDAGEPLVEAHHLGGAIATLRKVGGARERIETLIKRMMAAQRNAKYVSIAEPVDLSTEMASGKTHVAGKDLRIALLHLAHVANVPAVADLRRLVEDFNEVSITAKLFPAALTSSDHRVIKHMPALSSHDTDETRDNNRTVIRWQMWTEARRFHLRAFGYIDGARRQIVEEHWPRIDDLLKLTAASCLVPPGHERLFARGLHSGFYGDFDVACHLLVPQFENGLRYFVQESLGKPMIAIDRDGAQMVNLLKRLLCLPDLEKVLGEDLLFDLQGLLVMQESLNLRNNLSHGLLGDHSFGVEAAYFWWLCLRVCVLLVPASPPAPTEAPCD